MIAKVAKIEAAPKWISHGTLFTLSELKEVNVYLVSIFVHS